MTETNKRMLLRRRPEGLLDPGDFEVVEEALPEPADGEALMRNVYLGIDPTVRTWLSTARSYFPPVEIGEVVRCAGAGVVVETRCDAYEVGEIVTSLPGWQEYAIVRDDAFTSKLPRGSKLRHALGVLGGSGMTAWFGLMDVGRPREGETVVVSGAAGATGSLVGQFARRAGCRVVGIAGTEEKCRWAVEELGFDACLDHHREDFREALVEACPKRIDIYFDNVGGWILDVVLTRLAMHARVVLCGAISVYNEAHRPPGPANYLDLITVRGRMEGFNAFDYWDRYPETSEMIAELLDSGEIRSRETVVEGLGRAWEAVNMLFTGGNVGKLLVQVSGDPTDRSAAPRR